MQALFTFHRWRLVHEAVDGFQGASSVVDLRGVRGVDLHRP